MSRPIYRRRADGCEFYRIYGNTVTVVTPQPTVFGEVSIKMIAAANTLQYRRQQVLRAAEFRKQMKIVIKQVR